MLSFRNGNILDSKADIIVQQVNCRGVMGAGLAKQIRAKWPCVYDEYCTLCQRRDPHDLLGTMQMVSTPDGTLVANCFGQLNYGYGQQHTDYEALRHALEQTADYAAAAGTPPLTIAIPNGIGCGLAGGDWHIVQGMLIDLFGDVSKYASLQVTVWLYR